MGFISAVRDLGELEARKSDGSGCDDLDSFLQLPMPLIEDEERRGKVIRVWLNVDDPGHNPLNVGGIGKIDLVDYMAGDVEVEENKRRYLYRKPVGSNVSWGFSPIYKLGKGEVDGIEKLLGKKEKWRSDKDSRFYKLEHRVLADYEKSGVLEDGATERIMEELEGKADRIAELWSDKKRSYLLLFGIDSDGTFLYPGDVEAFRNYFSAKLEKNLGGGISGTCGLCGCTADLMVNMDKVFKFATFDKVSFLPGASDGKGVKEKVFPICDNCFSALSRGREVLDGAFLDGRTIPGVKIYIVPELLLGPRGLQIASRQTQDFIHSGIGLEGKVFRKLARQNNSLVFHFLFWEKNQAQERLHLMIEDVPPSQLKRLEDLWVECHRAFLWNSYEDPVFDPKNVTLDQGIRMTFHVLASLAGKSKQDKLVMREWTLGILGRLLGGERVDVRGVKQLMISRFTGLFANSEWLRFGGVELRKMAAVIDFLTRSNRR